MRKLLLTSILLLLSNLALANPDIPWAEPQYFGNFDNQRFDLPRFEAVEQGDQLEQGAEGDAVEQLQLALLDMGFALPAGADSDFGGQTEAAVKAFQSSRGLPISGVVDRPTLAALDSVTPAPGKKLWQDPIAAQAAIDKCPTVGDKRVRVLIDLSEHRLAVYSDTGSLMRVFPVASGASETPTHVGLKIVNDKIADPGGLAQKLWPKSGNKAFGTRLIDLSWYDPNGDVLTNSDEELHGTYVDGSIGCQASHGCVRMHNEDIEWMYQNLRRGDLVLVRD